MRLHKLLSTITFILLVTLATPKSYALSTIAHIKLPPPPSKYSDFDGDGYGVSTTDGEIDLYNLRQTSDPDDFNAQIHPAAADVSKDGIDQNGDGIDGPAFDQYGGWIGIQREATGFFRVEKIDNRWWFITPEGHPFFQNGTSGTGHTKRRGPDGQEYAPYIYAQAIQNLGFNTVALYDTTRSLIPLSEGKWTKGFPDTRPYYIPLWANHMNHKTGRVVDFFEPDWAEKIEKSYTPLLQYHKNTRNLMGYSYGLEYHWFPDHKNQNHVFDDYMHLDENAPGKRILIDFMRDYYQNDIAQLNSKWDSNLDSFEELASLKTLGPKSFFSDNGWSGQNEYNLNAMIKGISKGLLYAAWNKKSLLTFHQSILKEKFAAIPADKFYGTIHDLVRKHAPNHLLMGDQQVVISGSKSVAKVVAKYSDVYSVNPYPTNFWASLFAQTLLLLSSGGYTDGLLSTGFGSDLVSDITHVIGDKPIWIEFGVIGDDTEHFNDAPGNFAMLPSQEKRTEFLEVLYDLYLQSDNIVGIQYYAWNDQPTGRDSNGQEENNQFGLNSHEGKSYPLISSRYKELNTWWLARLRTSHQKGPEDLTPVKMPSGHSTGSIKRLEEIRNTFELLKWAGSTWKGQDLYSKVKSLEIQMNKLSELAFSDVKKFKLAQFLYQLNALHTVKNINDVNKVLKLPDAP